MPLMGDIFSLTRNTVNIYNHEITDIIYASSKGTMQHKSSQAKLDCNAFIPCLSQLFSGYVNLFLPLNSIKETSLVI